MGILCPPEHLQTPRTKGHGGGGKKKKEQERQSCSADTFQYTSSQQSGWEKNLLSFWRSSPPQLIMGNQSFSTIFSHVHSHILYAHLYIFRTTWQIPWRYMEKVQIWLWDFCSYFACSRNENKAPSCCICYKDSGRHLLTKRPPAPFQSLVIRHTRPARDPYRWGDDVRVLQTEPDWILSQAWWLISAQCFWPPTQTAPLSLSAVPFHCLPLQTLQNALVETTAPKLCDTASVHSTDLYNIL